MVQYILLHIIVIFTAGLSLILGWLMHSILLDIEAQIPNPFIKPLEIRCLWPTEIMQLISLVILQTALLANFQRNIQQF